MIKELLYKLFNIEPFPCNSCETLRSQLDVVNFEKNQLLNRLLNPVQPIQSTPVEYEPIPGKNIPWAVRRQMLEAEDRIKAKLMRDAPKPESVPKSTSLDSLEKELGINQIEEVK